MLAEKFMKLFGKDLVSALPRETTGFLIVLCTADDRSAGPGRELLCSNPEDFIRCFTEQNRHLRFFLGDIVERKPERATKLVWTTLLELLLRWNPRVEAAGRGGSTSPGADAASELPREEQIMELLKEGWSTNGACSFSFVSFRFRFHFLWPRRWGSEGRDARAEQGGDTLLLEEDRRRGYPAPQHRTHTYPPSPPFPHLPPSPLQSRTMM